VSNLRTRGYVKMSAVFENPLPALIALLTHFLWGAAGYALAWQALKARERK
jgi:hypothetical protein